jgi:hypothetical protein
VSQTLLGEAGFQPFSPASILLNSPRMVALLIATRNTHKAVELTGFDSTSVDSSGRNHTTPIAQDSGNRRSICFIKILHFSLNHY